MFQQFQSVMRNMVIYSALVSDYEKLDFKNDALAGVRANFFNSGRSPQRETTEITVDSADYRLCYSMESGKPFSWKATRDGLPYQSTERGENGSYCVITYGSMGTACKRQFFDKEHFWLRTEYCDREIANKMLAEIYPRHIRNTIALVFESYTADGKLNSKLLFPCAQKPSGSSPKVLIYSDFGMIWYDESFAAEDLTARADGSSQKKNSGFKFLIGGEANASVTSKRLDLGACGYLTDDAEIVQSFNGAPAADNAEKTYSAYEAIEKILVEAHKSNENLFGEIQQPENDASEDISETGDSEILQPRDNADPKVEKDLKYETASGKARFKKDDAAGESVLTDEKRCNMVVLTKSGRYSYYGELDKNNCRTGRGRTVLPDGLTSYDGEYKDDMRSGFGVCYYKNGAINYAGNWADNTRSGRGVGYRLSDGTMHAGTWFDNSPEGVGARFDGSGNFIDVCSYSGGVRSGKSVSFDKDGNVVVTVYENGEKISEHIIDDEVLKSI